MSKKLFLWLGLSPLLISLIIAIIILSLFKLLPPKLPLFYSLPWGEGQLATPQQFLIIPASIIIVTLLNLVISGQLHEQQTFFKRMLLISSITITLILTISFVKIILMFV